MTTYPQTGNVPTQAGVYGDQFFREAREMLEAHLRGMWRYRWIVVLVMWLVCIVGWAAVYALPPVYQASARIFVDTENAIRPLLRGIATPSDVMSEVTVVTREMLSRPNLAEVARATDLDLRAKTDEQFEALLGTLQKRIGVIGNRDNVFTIHFQDADREMAVSVVESLVNTFVEKSLVADRSESNQAQAFLQAQINDYETRLTAAEDRLAKFKQDNVALMPNQRGDYFDRLQSANAAMESARDRLQVAQERRAELLRQLEGEEPVFGIMSPMQSDAGDVAGFESAKIRELELQLEELRLQYTDKHPRIGQILETIKLLKEQEKQERAAAAARDSSTGAAEVNPLDRNPVYQNMRIQLTNTEVEIASLRSELRQQQTQVEELKTLVDTVPQVEAELGRLNRDYDVVKSKYEQLLVKLETANIGEDVDASIDNVQFRIIDPPFSSREPAGPNRKLLLIASLLCGVGLAVAIAFILNQLQPVFFSGRAVTSITGLPILGAVNLQMSEKESGDSRRGKLFFVTAVVLLIASFTVVALFADQWSPVLRDIAKTVV